MDDWGRKAAGDTKAAIVGSVPGVVVVGCTLGDICIVVGAKAGDVNAADVRDILLRLLVTVGKDCFLLGAGLISSIAAGNDGILSTEDDEAMADDGGGGCCALIFGVVLLLSLLLLPPC